jgi:hypothetical protein
MGIARGEYTAEGFTLLQLLQLRTGIVFNGISPIGAIIMARIKLPA